MDANGTGGSFGIGSANGGAGGGPNGGAGGIDVSGNGMSITSGDMSPSLTDHTAFLDATEMGAGTERTFTIANTGPAALNLSGTPLIALSGPDAADFAVTANPATPVSESGTTTFKIAFTPFSSGSKAALVSIANNSSVSPFTFAISGTALADTDRGGTPDVTDPDDDNDLVSDIDEAADGSDPLNPDSFAEVAGGRQCADYNGFLGNFVQILELRNTDAGNVTFTLDVNDNSGAMRSSESFGLPPNRQIDVIANMLAGVEPISYGTLCTSTTAGADGALAGDLIFYRLTENSFSQAFSSPYMPARTGKQFLTFNTYFPARNFTQLGNAVAVLDLTVDDFGLRSALISAPQLIRFCVTSSISLLG